VAAPEGRPLVIDVLRVVLFQDELHEVAATAVADEGDAAPVLPFEIASPF
jgi:hypothetical protein